jgi:hypothetical protein
MFDVNTELLKMGVNQAVLGLKIFRIDFFFHQAVYTISQATKNIYGYFSFQL